jgi:hypothetical protein
LDFRDGLSKKFWLWHFLVAWFCLHSLTSFSFHFLTFMIRSAYMK